MKIRSPFASWVLGAAILSLSACGPVRIACGTDGYSENAANNHDYFWHDGTAVEFRFARNIPQTLQDSIFSAADVYNTTLSNTRITIGERIAPEQSGNKNEVSGDGINGVYIVSESDWWFYNSNPGAVAITNNMYTSDHIIETDVFFLVKDSAVAMSSLPKRGLDFSITQLASSAFNVFRPIVSHAEHSDLFDLGYQSLAATSGTQGATAIGMSTADFSTIKAKAFAVHEFGHVLGRCHTNNSTSIMQPTVTTSIYRTQPFLSDYDLDVLAEHYEVKQ